MSEAKQSKQEFIEDVICSICGMEDEGFIRWNYNYCPNCGAKMDLEG